MARILPVLGATDVGVAPPPGVGPAPVETSAGASAGAPPAVPLAALDQLWFQVAGTVCNLRCRHCFISCSPENHSFWFMERADVAAALEASVEMGVKEYYFTGGEPFMNRQMIGILADALTLGPATVLTNGTLLPSRTVDALARIASASRYTLEVRVSIDGVTEEGNDAIRGVGSFARALGGVQRLAEAGFLPIITTMQTWEDHETHGILEAFRDLLAGVGYRRARLKILPPLRMGEEAKRTHGYDATEHVTLEMMRGFDADLLLCSRARLVTAQGVWVCPILLDEPSARVGATLAEAARAPALLGHSACFTCYVSGALCANLPGFVQDHS